MRARLRLLLAVLLLAGACGDDKPAPPTSVDGFTKALASAGLEPGKLEPVEVAALAGGTCRRGDVSGMEVTLCEYDDPSRAKKLEAKGLEVVGDATGSSLAQGKLLLVVADRKNADKEGRRIDAITRAFRGQPQAQAKK
jgi:hypothetical protein